MVEENIAIGMCTVLSGRYLLHRLNASRSYVPEDYEELKSLFQKFERNIDKGKRKKLISAFTIK
jgi:hypothetical protein